MRYLRRNAGHMATRENAPASPPPSGPGPGVIMRQLKEQATLVLPAAVAFLGFHVFLLTRVALRLSLVQQGALFAGVICAAGSVLLLVFVLTRQLVPSTPELGEHQVRSLSWTFAGSIATLLIGASADIVLAVDVVSGSWTIGAVAAALLLATACWICW